MAKLSKDEIMKSVEEMTVLELSDLVKALEEKFGVSAQPVAVAGPITAGAGGGEPKEEQTVFNVVLTEMGAQKLAVIKAVRELVPTLGLTDAKALVESAPKEVITQVNKEKAQEAKKKLEAAGAKVELK
jgi:large subunit ribosomal protein L7/L12